MAKRTLLIVVSMSDGRANALQKAMVHAETARCDKKLPFAFMLDRDLSDDWFTELREREMFMIRSGVFDEVIFDHPDSQDLLELTSLAKQKGYRMPETV